MKARTSHRHLPRAAGALLAVALLGVGCTPEPDGSGGDATLRGRVTDADGSQYARVGGSGSIASATMVTAYTVTDAGSLEAIGSASVEADGSFEMDVPSGEGAVVVQALAVDGAVVASAILESTGEPGDTVTCTPLDTESSVEALVLIEMIGATGSFEAVNPVDVRLRVDADTAVAVRATFEEGGESEGEAAIAGLAEAILAAQATELAAWAEMGFETTQQAMFETEIAASQALSEDLYEGADAGSAWADFTSSLHAAFEGASGLGAGEQAEGEAQAGLAFRVVVDARLDGDLAWEATHCAAQNEAAIESTAIGALFAAAEAGTDAREQAEQAGTDLVTEVRAAESMAALAMAFSDFEASLIGGISVEGSALGSWLEVSGAYALVADAALDECVASAGDLETDLLAEVDLLLTGLGDTDTEAIASSVVSAWATHRATVEAALADAEPAIPAADAAVAADVTILATAAFGAVE